MTQPLPPPEPQPTAQDQAAGLPPTLVLDTGQDLTVVGPGRLGRAPTRPEDRTFTHVIALDDPEKSISKTHLEFGVTAGRLWVVDLDSTNGTRVFNLEGGVRQLKPGQRETVEPGETVQFGDRYFTVKDSP